MAVYLAFDYGEKRIGVAVGDDLTATARPLPTLTLGVPEALKLIAEWAPKALIAGLPIDEDGKDQPVTKRARKFAAALQQSTGLPLHWVDERYSSRAADDALRQARSSGQMQRKVRKGDRDGQAARIVLEQWLQEPQ